ncbi:hypothetical protein DS67_07240 [Mesotoga sp. SC_4PWA21]|jgi:hypothetical protein|nr:hypothetical protein DS67_07240 [Mesotoga sp. SC_4PWA21]
MKRLAIFLILFLSVVHLFSATGITLMGAFDMSSADLWVGAGLRSIGKQLVGFEFVIMAEQKAIFAGDFSNIQLLPTLYLNIPIEELSIYAGAAPMLTFLGNSVDLKSDMLYLRAGIQYLMSNLGFFLSASHPLQFTTISLQGSLGIEAGVSIYF